MKGTIILKGLVVIFCMMTVPKWTMAKSGKPLPGIKMDYAIVVRMVADTTAPGQKKSSDKTDEDSKDQTKVQEVKVIPIARKEATNTYSCTCNYTAD